MPGTLPRVYFQFESDDDVASFAINYRLVAAHIREPRDGRLNVKITLRDPAPPPDRRRYSPGARMTMTEGAPHLTEWVD